MLFPSARSVQSVVQFPPSRFSSYSLAGASGSSKHASCRSVSEPLVKRSNHGLHGSNGSKVKSGVIPIRAIRAIRGPIPTVKVLNLFTRLRFGLGGAIRSSVRSIRLGRPSCPAGEPAGRGRRRRTAWPRAGGAPTCEQRHWHWRRMLRVVRRFASDGGTAQPSATAASPPSRAWRQRSAPSRWNPSSGSNRKGGSRRTMSSNSSRVATRAGKPGPRSRYALGH